MSIFSIITLDNFPKNYDYLKNSIYEFKSFIFALLFTKIKSYLLRVANLTFVKHFIVKIYGKFKSDSEPKYLSLGSISPSINM